ncbi:concanavalin A-like lectin/glucanase [Teratosphaeria nubilosa]|uniref:Concanavalin A-like lectin/glucanase n=1 Tax=Teratosphaeria nubilosa TaxID=161662 RepID=A0A6G1LHE1_9PEZI|nr:concanavalin A-like lectin/glucanase [Teratosphaeria nubilosa]
MKPSTTLLYTTLASLTSAAPTKRTTQNTCEQWGQLSLSPYTIYNNLWGESQGSGSQCLDVVESLTTWSWANNKNDVKSYANAVVNFTQTQVSEIASMQSKWEWSYSGSQVTADVAFDMFTSSTKDGSREFEVMVWLAALGGAGPISLSYDAAGHAESIASTTIGGHSFAVYKGSNGAQTVFSFVPSTNITSYSGDVRDFFTYLISSQSFDGSQYLVSVGAGTEAFIGTNAVFKTTSYSMDISTSDNSCSTSTASSTPTFPSATSSPPLSTSPAAANTTSHSTTTSAPDASSSTPTSVSTVSSAPASSYWSAPGATSTFAYTATVFTPTAYPEATSFSSSAAAPVSTSEPEHGSCQVEYVYV